MSMCMEINVLLDNPTHTTAKSLLNQQFDAKFHLSWATSVIRMPLNTYNLFGSHNMGVFLGQRVVDNNPYRKCRAAHDICLHTVHTV